jgi:glycyl-tRNA synthetase beta chain
MSEFLLEIYSEEIPARMQNKAIADFKNIFLDFCRKENIKIDANNIENFISPRRIVLIVNNLDSFHLVPAIQKIGPKFNSPKQAIEGFARSVGLQNQSDLEIIENSKGKYYAFNKKAEKTPMQNLLANNLESILQKMSHSWPKNMRWQNDKRKPKWVRPIRNILAIFDGKIVNFQFSDVKSSNKTFGHNLLTENPVEIKNINDFREKLNNNFVILDQEERKNLICQKINKICNKYNLKLTEDLENSTLLQDVVGLTEFPNVTIAEIDSEFMLLPKEVLILTAKLHQKYFCLQGDDGNLAPYFIFVGNVKITKKIILDNQKVLKARLSDAKFFIDEDLKIPFSKRLEDLKNIIFYENLGTVYDKVKRIESVNKLLALWIPKADLFLVERLANLSKNDLNTKCVAELPELQGVIGGYYTKIQEKENNLSKAISEHYLPLGPNSKLPQTPLGCLLSLSDKIDTICALFLIGKKPTSSKDPMGLRRAALGIIRIIIKDNLAIPLRLIVKKSINNFPNKLIKINHPNKKGKEIKLIKSKAALEIIEFIIERLKSVLKDDLNIRPDIANNLLDHYFDKIPANRKFDISKLVFKAKFINEFVDKKSSHNIILLYKRAVNIVTIEEKRDGKIYDSRPHLLSMRNKFEKDLYKKTKYINSKVKYLNKNNNYKEIFNLFEELEGPLNAFFENLKVNDANSNVRENRLCILGKIRNLFNSIFDFSAIEK